jgi:hypothetical protein
MVFNTTFNNIVVISWQSVLLVEENGVPGEIHLELILSHTPLSTHCSCVEYPTANGRGLSHGTTLNVIP